MATISGNHKDIIKTFSDFFMQSPYPNYIKDADYKFLSVSDSLATYFGIEDASSLIGKTSFELIKDSRIASLYDEFDRELSDTSDTLDRVLPSFVDSNGIQRYARVSRSIIKDEEGNIVGILGNLYDYTMTYEAKKRFERQAQKYLQLPNKAYCCAFIDVTEWKMLDFTTVKDNHLIHSDITVDDFLMRADRTISSDSNAHKYFADFRKSEVLKKFNSGEPSIATEFMLEKDDGTILWINFEYIFTVDPETDHVCILMSVYDVSAQRKEMDNLIKAAEQDSMTGLLNHESAMNRIRQYTTQENRNNLNALFIIDIDNFKDINDTFGHRTGDTVIVEFAERISASFKESDIVGRIGGDEFIVLMKDIDSVFTATNKAAELINTLQYECRREGRSIFLTSSIGIALFSDAVKAEDLYSEADEALYNAKYSGKNKYILSENGDFSSFDSSSKVGDVAIDLKTVLNGIDGVMFIIEVEGDDLKILYSSNSHYNQMTVEQMPADEYSRLLYVIKRANALEEPIEYTSPKPQTYRDKQRWLHITGNFLESDNPKAIKASLIVTDVFSFKDAQQKLEIENTKNNLALSISNMLIWEYDISTRFITLHNSNEKSVPYWCTDMCYTQSKDEYISLYTSIDEGAKEGSEFVHFKNFFGYETWMQVSFRTTYDDSGKITGALFAAVDVTNLMNITDKYQGTMRRYDKVVDEDKSAFHLNLSENSIISAHLNDGLPRVPDLIKTADEFFKFITRIVNCTDDRRSYLEATLTVKNSLDRMDIGTEIINEDLFCQLSSNDCEWFGLRLYFLTNPDTNCKEVVGFMRNIHAERTSQMIIDSFISLEYELLAVIDTAKCTLKIIKEKTPKYLEKQDTYDFEDMLYACLPDYVVENELQECAYNMDIHNIIKQLSLQKVYTIGVSVYENENNQVVIHRKRYQYTYIDDAKRYIAITKVDITDQYKSEFDPVSGLYNRTAFYKKAKALIASNPRTSYVIVRWDIDRFKIYNDTFGAEAGDELLAMIGNSYRDIVSDDMIVANLGADNFAFCMPNNNFDPEGHIEYLNNVLSSISDKYILTFHMAGYKVTDSTLDIGSMCDRAAIAIKSIKEQISTRFIWYDDTMRDNAVQEQNLISEIKNALDNDEFCIFVQPQFNQITNTLVGGEVLVRWQKPDGTIVSPGEFIPLMERSGLVSRLDEVIWEKAVAYISERIHANLPITPLAVNISRRDFFRPHFCNIFYDLIQKYDIEAKYLDLEVTESAYIENTTLLNDIIDELRSKGFKFKMDDFGTGYSSLNTLKNVPVDMIKLDMAFIDIDSKDKTANFRGGVILDSVLRMTHWLGIPVIAEGVETAQQAEFLKSIDCAIIQGYYFSAPLSLKDFSALLDKSVSGDELPSYDVSSSFDNYDFWDPTSHSAILFNSFIGPAGVFELYNGQIAPLRLNDLFYSELGLKVNDFNFYNANFFELIHDDCKDILLDVVSKASTSSEEVTFECKWYSPLSLKSDNKDILWLRLRVRRIAYNDERVVVFVGVENTTGRKNLELKNKKYTERLSNFIEKIPAGVIAFEVTDSVRITYVNAKYYALFGLDIKEPGEEIGIDNIHPDDRDKLYDAIWSITETDQRVFKMKHKCGNGSYKTVNARFLLSSFEEDKTIGYCLLTEENENKHIMEDVYDIETIAAHTDRLITRFDIKGHKLIHYFKFSDFFDIPSDASAESIEDLNKYGVIKAEINDNDFYNAMTNGTTKDKVVIMMKEKGGEYAPYYCRTSIISDDNNNPLFAIMSLQKKTD